jgi:hypothetical protein
MLLVHTGCVVATHHASEERQKCCWHCSSQKYRKRFNQLERSLTHFPSSIFSKTCTKITIVLSDEFTYSWWVEILFPLEIYFGWVIQPSQEGKKQTSTVRMSGILFDLNHGNNKPNITHPEI